MYSLPNLVTLTINGEEYRVLCGSANIAYGGSSCISVTVGASAVAWGAPMQMDNYTDLIHEYGSYLGLAKGDQQGHLLLLEADAEFFPYNTRGNNQYSALKCRGFTVDTATRNIVPTAPEYNIPFNFPSLWVDRYHQSFKGPDGEYYLCRRARPERLLGQLQVCRVPRAGPRRQRARHRERRLPHPRQDDRRTEHRRLHRGCAGVGRRLRPPIPYWFHGLDGTHAGKLMRLGTFGDGVPYANDQCKSGKQGLPNNDCTGSNAYCFNSDGSACCGDRTNLFCSRDSGTWATDPYG